MSGAVGGSDTPQRNWNNLPDLLRTIPVKLSIEDGKISDKTTMGKSLERSGEAKITDEKNGLGLDFV